MAADKRVMCMYSNQPGQIASGDTALVGVGIKPSTPTGTLTIGSSGFPGNVVVDLGGTGSGKKLTVTGDMDVNGIETVIGDTILESNVQLGDAPTDTITFEGRVIPYTTGGAPPVTASLPFEQSTDHIIAIDDMTFVDGFGGSLTIKAGNSGDASVSPGSIGGTINIYGGYGGLGTGALQSGVGGPILIAAGPGGGDLGGGGNTGGEVTIQGGSASGTANGGDVHILGGGKGGFGTDFGYVYLGDAQTYSVYIGLTGVTSTYIEGPVTLGATTTDYVSFGGYVDDDIIFRQGAPRFIMIDQASVATGDALELIGGAAAAASNANGGDIIVSGGPPDGTGITGSVSLGSAGTIGSHISFNGWGQTNLIFDSVAGPRQISVSQSLPDTTGVALQIYAGQGGNYSLGPFAGDGAGLSLVGGVGGAGTAVQAAGVGGPATLQGGTAGLASAGPGGNGGPANINGGTASGTGTGGGVNISGGSNGDGPTVGGTVTIDGGIGSSAANHGDIGIGRTYADVVYIGNRGADRLIFSGASPNAKIEIQPGTVLEATGTGTINLPNNTGASTVFFQIGGTAVSAANITAANFDRLFNGSDASAAPLLHTHSGLSGATTIESTETSLSALNKGMATRLLNSGGNTRVDKQDAVASGTKLAFTFGLAKAAIVAPGVVTLVCLGQCATDDLAWDAAPAAADIGKPVYGSTATIGRLSLTPSDSTGWTTRVGYVYYATTPHVAGSVVVFVQPGEVINNNPP